MNKGFDVVALGDLLIDFPENGKSAQGNGLFEACPGERPFSTPIRCGVPGKREL